MHGMRARERATLRRIYYGGCVWRNPRGRTTFSMQCAHADIFTAV
jgi:hypothetical protein